MPTKKVVAVATPKKAPVRAVAKKTVRKPGVSELVYASNDESFWTASGEVLNSLVALRDALGAMSKTTFAHHVAAHKHDFAEWVESVLLDSACASDLRKAKTAAAAKTVVVRHLKRYGV